MKPPLFPWRPRPQCAEYWGTPQGDPREDEGLSPSSTFSQGVAASRLRCTEVSSPWLTSMLGFYSNSPPFPPARSAKFLFLQETQFPC